MLATPKLMCEAAQSARLKSFLPHWRNVPLYQNALAQNNFSSLPLMNKRELRDA